MKKVAVLSLVAGIILCSCGLKQKRTEQKLKNTIVEYMQANVEGLQVDSVHILGTDSLSDMDFAYMNKVMLQNAEQEIEGNYLLYVEPETPEERVDQYELNERLEWVKAKMCYWDSVMLDDATDTVKLQYYFVASRIYGKIGETVQTFDVGFPISTDFKVQEIQLFKPEE